MVMYLPSLSIPATFPLISAARTEPASDRVKIATAIKLISFLTIVIYPLSGLNQYRSRYYGAQGMSSAAHTSQELQAF
jgi:hypothetical protein